MDKAIDELKYTITLAAEYFASGTHHLEELQCHAAALKEDAELAEKTKSGDKNADRDVDDVIRQARRLKRDLDKLTFPLLRAKEAARLHLQKEELELQKKIFQRRETTDSPRTGEKKVSSVKLPTIKLPVFSGEVEQFKGFRQIFLDLIEEDVEMSSTKKWLLLKEHLSGKALEIVQELPASPETYKVAMELLEEAFGSINKAVTHLYHRLQQVPVSTMGAENLRLTHAKLDGMLRSLELLGEDISTNRFLRTVVISKFPTELFNQLKITDEMDLPKFRKKIAGYIKSNENSLETLPLYKPSSSTTPAPSNGNHNKNNRFRSRPSNEKPPSSSSENSSSPCSSSQNAEPPSKKPFLRGRKCTFCSAAHYSDQCDVYKTLEQRRQKLGDRCDRCLRGAHPGKECARIIKCAHCEDITHNRALCPKNCAPAEKACHVRDISTVPAPSSQISSKYVVQEVLNAEYVTLMITVAESPAPQHLHETRALIDTASRRTLIKRSLAEKLNLKIQLKNAVKILGVANVPVSSSLNPTCKIYLHPPNHHPILVEAVILENVIDDVKAASVEEFRKKYPQFDQLPIPDEGNGKEVELLIGTRSLLPIFTPQNSIIVNSSIQLLSTKFGWVLFGAFDDAEDAENASIAAMVVQAYDPVKLMCELDILGLKGIENDKQQEEALALNKFYETIHQLEDKRYEVSLPKRYDPVDLEENFGLAWGRLQSLWKRLIHTPILLQAYDDQIKNQEKEKIVEKITCKSPADRKVHYIAHQVVVREDKSTPVRIVTDASAHPAGKRSLNDNVLKGANWVDDMPTLLLRFRKKEIAVTADISKAFHQLSIREEDRDLCRFIWLKDITKPPTKENIQVYRFCRVAFGIASSPFLLYATMKYHLRSNPHEFTEVLENDFYADNFVTSIPANTNLPNFYSKIKQTFSSMSMNLTKWTSNSTKLRQIIPVEDQATENEQAVLGMCWNICIDEMSLQVKQNVFQNEAVITKRRLLKEAATIFDPLGWAMPIVLLARIFIRKIWKLNYTWDAPLPEALCNEWQKIRQALQSISSIRLSRRMFTCPRENDTKLWQLHIFSDASIEAYAVVIFIKSIKTVSFVAAKARLSPNAKLSIPRLELIAAVIAARYAAYIQRALKIEKFNKVILWSDSRCVLSWLNTTKILPAFVHKNIAEIRTYGISAYNYVPTELNPADVASRGAELSILQNMNWWKGPSWLVDEAAWPKQNIDYDDKKAENAALQVNKEEKILLTRVNASLQKFNPANIQNAPFQLNPNDFTCFENLLKRSAYILFAINKIFSSRIKRKPFNIEREKTNYAFVKTIWLRWDQTRAYAKIPRNRKSNVAYLRNFEILQDENNILHCSTRLQNSGKNEETIYPILLVKDSPLTKLIVMSAHFNNFHSGTAFTLAAIRRQYWLPNGRQQVFKIIRQNCTVCKKFSAKPFALPEMAPLPEFRVKEVETPFTRVGIDIFGPIFTRLPTQGNKKQKRWILILTCLTVRAIHLELLEDMTSLEILEALRRFFARRGTPEMIVSDNAPQFHVVERRFVSIWHYVAENEQIVSYFAKKEIVWKFIPPHSPWMGGVYERLIKTVKNAFEKTYSIIIMTDKQITTILLELEAMLNSRPISYVDKAIDTIILTPNHFLQLKFPAIPVNFAIDQPMDQITELWKAGENFLNVFWNKWAENYLLALRERSNDMKNPHLTEKRKPIVGEVVLMVEPSSKRSTWKKAIIERVIVSDDGEIRAAQIKVANGIRMIRPINKLLPLDLISGLPKDDQRTLNRQMDALVHPLPESAHDEDGE